MISSSTELAAAIYCAAVHDGTETKPQQPTEAVWNVVGRKGRTHVAPAALKTPTPTVDTHPDNVTSTPGRVRTEAERLSDLVSQVEVCKELIRRTALGGVLRSAAVVEALVQQCGKEQQADAKPLSWDKVTFMVVFGLGSPEKSRTARYQVALAALLVSDLLHLNAPVEVYDPVLTKLDKILLEGFGWKVAESADTSKRQVTVPTLFYLPHCPLHLADSILACNACDLSKIAMLSNSFAHVKSTFDVLSHRAQQQHAEGKASRIVQVAQDDLMAEVPLHMPGVPLEAFNDMSFHILYGSLPP